MSKLVAKNDIYIEQLVTDPLYRIDSDGSIYTSKDLSGRTTDSWRKISTTKSKSGHKSIRYKEKHLTVHRIIYRKFIGTLDANLVTNHKDGNPANNHFKNLELVTQSENNEHRYRTLGHPPVLGARKLTTAEVTFLRSLRAHGWSYSRLMAKFQVSKSTISYIVNQKTYK